MLDKDVILQNRYRIVRVLGGGGMGQVYLAHDTRLADKPCAIKELTPDPHAPPEEQELAAEQFHREAAILAHLSHPNLPNVYDYFEEANPSGQGECFYLVMDYVEGEDLTERLDQSPDGLDQEIVVEWAIQLCDVLEYLHNQTPPVIFRDMKPANVMITHDGTIKLIDFGVARLFDPSKRTDTLKMGTAGYAPPEQYAGQGQTTARSDIYALGATLHELLTGDDPTAHPFVFSPPRTLKPSISPSLSEIVIRAVNLDPGDRFPSVRAMKEALEKTTRPRRFRIPTIQRQESTGTKVMPETTTVSLPQSRATQAAKGTLRWLGRITLTIAITLLIATVVLLIAGTYMISSVVERGVANIDWGLVEDANHHFEMTEGELQTSVQGFLQLYALDAIKDVRIDFRTPDQVTLSLELSSRPISLQARLDTQDGVPSIVLERMNDTPLYIVGGIVSAGINRGFQKAWEDSPLQITSLTVKYNRLTIDLEPRK